jgi:hypothetical protein
MDVWTNSSNTYPLATEADAMKRLIAVTIMLLSIIALGGCEPATPNATGDQDIIAVQKSNLELNAKVVELENRVAQQSEQITTLQGLGEARMDDLYYVDSVTLGKFTGGWDFDGDDIEDGVRVFIVPQDQYDSLLKSAGSVKVQLYDLNADPSEVLLAERTWTPAEMTDAWASGFMGSHFSLDCPWTQATPTGSDVTVRVEFVDSLTGKTFRAQKLCAINRGTTEDDAEAASEEPAE